MTNIEPAPKRVLTPVEKLPMLVALEKLVKDELETVRRECNGILLEGYESMDVEKRALKVGGQKVGEFTVTFNKEGFEITDQKAFEEFALDYGMATTRRRIRPDMEQSIIRYLENNLDPEVFAEAVEEEVVLDPEWEKGMTRVGNLVTYLDSGMNVPGVEFRSRTVKGTRVTDCKPADVLPLMQQLEGGVTAFLTGGDAA